MNTLHKPLHLKSLPLPQWLQLLATLACLADSASLHATAISCSINSLGLAFPLYDASNPAPTDSIGSVDVQCTNFDTSAGSTNVAVGISAGSNGPVNDRKMAGSSGLLRYGVFSDGARSINWGQGMDAVQQSTGAMASNQSTVLHYTLFGRIPAQQNVPAGTYQDALVLTLTP